MVYQFAEGGGCYGKIFTLIQIEFVPWDGPEITEQRQDVRVSGIRVREKKKEVIHIEGYVSDCARVWLSRMIPSIILSQSYGERLNSNRKQEGT